MPLNRIQTCGGKGLQTFPAYWTSIEPKHLATKTRASPSPTKVRYSISKLYKVESKTCVMCLPLQSM